MDGSSSSPVFYLNCAGGAAFHNLSHVRQTIQDAGFSACRVDDVSRELGLLSLQGPHSRKLLGKLVDGGEEALSNEHFPFYTHKVLEVAGHKVRQLDRDMHTLSNPGFIKDKLDFRLYLLIWTNLCGSLAHLF